MWQHLIINRLPLRWKLKLKTLKSMLSTITSPFPLPSVIVPAQVKPSEMYKVIQAYHALPTDQAREEISRFLLEKLVLDPTYGRLLETDYCQTRFGNEELYRQALGAMHFARGNVAEAIRIFEMLVKHEPSPFNYLCLSRCLSLGLGKEAEAITILTEGLKNYPNELALTINLATACFRLGKTRMANDCLDQVRPDVINMLRPLTPEINRLSKEIARALDEKLLDPPRGNKNDWFVLWYAEENIEQIYWEPYWASMNTHTRFQNGFGWINWLYQEKIKNIISEFREIHQFINFGVMCANPDFHLAKQFPEVEFIGVDREKITAELNQYAYRLPNIKFITAKITDVLPQIMKNGKKTILFHARTATLCYPQFLKKLYATCHRYRVEYIVLYENLSLSRQYFNFFDFDEMPADSIAYRSVQFIHNYPKLLREAGYDIITSERISASNLLEAKVALGDTHAFIVARIK